MDSKSIFNTKIVIVVSEFNKVIIESLLNGAIDAYCKNGGDKDNLIIHRVPGAFEIPGTVKRVLDAGSPDAIITLGAVIRGETPHFDFVAQECARGICDISMNYDIPILFGVLTTDNFEQALNRSGSNSSNKGWEVMQAAIKTIDVYKDIKSKQIA